MTGQHGFARTLPWLITVANDGQSAICELSQNDHTLELWPYSFKLKYTVSIHGKDMKTSLHVCNTDEKAFEFTALLHTYLGVPDIAQVKVKGLQGLNYADKLDGGCWHQETRDDVTIESEVDRNYISFPHLSTIEYPGTKLTLSTDAGLTDLVLWNPWIEKAKALADFGDDDYKSMVCLEAGKIITPVKLEPGAFWTGSQTLSVTFD